MELVGDVDPVELALESDVQEDDIGLEAECEPEGVLPGAGHADDLKTHRCQAVPQVEGDNLLVLHDEEAARGAGRQGGAGGGCSGESSFHPSSVSKRRAPGCHGSVNSAAGGRAG
jgi:hypothetical protein